MSEKHRTYVQKDGTVQTKCPNCGKARPLKSDEMAKNGCSAEVKCTCGKTFLVFAEFRKAYRRNMNLSGVYTKQPSGNGQGEIQVINLSMTGVGFTADGSNGLSKGDELALKITCDDGEPMEIQAVVEVVHIRDNFFGCQFKELSPQNEEALVSYLVAIP